ISRMIRPAASLLMSTPNKPSLILQPNWSQIYIGEKVTLRCEIQGGTEWTYEWRPTNRNFPPSSEYSIISATESHSGEYSCRGKRGSSVVIFILLTIISVIIITLYNLFLYCFSFSFHQLILLCFLCSTCFKSVFKICFNVCFHL
uniref:Ig-like domain-containing protein n=1 Tax=Xiphophorus maculatus TaxID=8083 RepID=A0A3B5Q692_XIPMA